MFWKTTSQLAAPPLAVVVEVVEERFAATAAAAEGVVGVTGRGVVAAAAPAFFLGAMAVFLLHKKKSKLQVKECGRRPDATATLGWAIE